jgi:DNA-directed RNA polymerase subunit RPC12/RpoP
LLSARDYGMFCNLMSEFKYACPVCGQHIKCDSSQTGTQMECPTCFQKITVPQAPDTDDQKLIIKGTKVGNERPTPKISEATPIAAPEKGFPGVTVVLIILVCIAAAVGFVYRGTIFKAAAGGATNQVAAASNETQTVVPPTPKPIGGPASVIFAKGDSFVLGSTNEAAETMNPAKTAFLDAFKADLASPLAFEAPGELSAMTVGGREVPGAGGEIQWHNSFRGGLVIGVTLQGLTPNHEYVLTLNGDAQHPGNGHLPDQMTHNNGEKFYDFSTITTDANGRYQMTFGIALPASQYDVLFFVKDTADWKIVLSHSFFQFTAE